MIFFQIKTKLCAFSFNLILKPCRNIQPKRWSQAEWHQLPGPCRRQSTRRCASTQLVIVNTLAGFCLLLTGQSAGCLDSGICDFWYFKVSKSCFQQMFYLMHNVNAQAKVNENKFGLVWYLQICCKKYISCLSLSLGKILIWDHLLMISNLN